MSQTYQSKSFINIAHFPQKGVGGTANKPKSFEVSEISPTETGFFFRMSDEKGW